MQPETKSDTEQLATFARFMRLGQIAHTEGDHRLAHEYWQKAAVLQPDNEQVWTALMWVLTDDNDRRVCLQNILAINPNNTQARDLLDAITPITTDEQATASNSPTTRLQASNTDTPSISFRVQYVLLRTIEIITMGTLLAIGWEGLRWLLRF